MTTERDPRTRLVLSWLREDTHENAERVLLLALDEVDTTPQRRSWWPAWRNFQMNTYARLIAAAAAVLVVAIGGYQFLPGRSGSGGTNATPSPSPALLARGTFVIRHWDTVAFEATREGFSVTGRMTVGVKEGTSDFLRVDLQCARTTEDGLIMIGGYTDGAGGRFTGISEGTLAAIALKRGAPVEAQISVGSAVNWPATQTTDCLAYLDATLTWERTASPSGDWLRDDISGTVEFGPFLPGGSGFEGTNATPSPSPVLLARGNFADGDWGPVQFEATREGSIVTGRMTINLEGEIPPHRAEAGFVRVDFHCARTTEDGLLMIGGYVTDGAGLQFRVDPEGTLAALFLKRGSPVAGQLRTGTLVNLPATQTTDCLAYLDAWLPEVGPWLGGSIRGTVEFGP